MDKRLTSLDVIGCHWTSLDVIGRHWMSLDVIGRHWVLLDIIICHLLPFRWAHILKWPAQWPVFCIVQARVGDCGPVARTSALSRDTSACITGALPP